MIGDSQSLKQVMGAIARAAPTNATVLIQGESGVGKELVARTIHRNSLRSRERFVQVNCAAIPEELSSRSSSSRKGIVHRRHREAGRQVRAGGSRHDLSRRSRRHEREDAGQGAACCRKARWSGSGRRAP